MTYKLHRALFTIQSRGKKKHKNHEFHQWIIDVALGTIVSISVWNSSIISANSIRARPIKTRVSLKQIDKLGEIRSNDQPQNGHDKCRRAKQEFQFAPRTWPEYRLTKIPRFLYGSPSAWTNSRPAKHVRNIWRDFRCFFYRSPCCPRVKIQRWLSFMIPCLTVSWALPADLLKTNYK